MLKPGSTFKTRVSLDIQAVMYRVYLILKCTHSTATVKDTELRK